MAVIIAIAALVTIATFLRLPLLVFYYLQNNLDTSNDLPFLAATIAKFLIDRFVFYYLQNILDTSNYLPFLAVTIANV